MRNNADPIIVLQQFGHALIQDSIQGYKNEGDYFNQKSFHEWLSNIFGKLFGNNDIDRMISAMWYLPLGFVVLSMMMTAGIMLEVYMPLIPFILFTLGGIGWLLGVIEAMVAAPIVCFGIMHPNSQNDFVGRAEPAVMLIINMFLRPALMLIGMMLGIGLIYVSLEVINAGYSQVVGSMLTYGSNLQDPFTATCLMAIYSLFVVLVVQKCFSLISIIPDNVLRWIQGGDVTRQQFGEMGQIEQQMSQKLGSAAGQLSQGVASTGQQQAQGNIQIAGNNQSAEDSLLRM